MKQVIDIEDLYLFVEKYEKYFLEHRKRAFLDPQGLRYAIQRLSVMRGFFIDD